LEGSGHWPLQGICLGLIKSTKNLSGYPVIRTRFKTNISQIRSVTFTPICSVQRRMNRTRFNTADTI
jgi:hypothetical protein